MTNNDVPMDDVYWYDDIVVEDEEPESCEPYLDDPFCTNLWWSFYKAFTMMLGESPFFTR